MQLVTVMPYGAVDICNEILYFLDKNFRQCDGVTLEVVPIMAKA